MSLLGLIYSQAAAQINLVPNPSFEEYDSCPQTRENFVVSNWNNPTTASPDNFSQCNISPTSGVPQNDFGFQYPRTGLSYIGIHSKDYSYSQGGSSEYIQCQLLKSLEYNKKYKVEFYLSLADENRIACDNIGAYFSQNAISKTDALSFDLEPNIFSEPKMPVVDKENWVKVSSIYQAKGGEEFMTIGMLSNFDSVFWIVVDSNGLFRDAYYYIDDVSVTEIDNTPFVLPTAFTPNGDGSNDLYFPLYFDSLLNVKEFRIYNSWGEMIYDNPNIPWDGTYRGQPQSSGIYSYYVYVDLPVPDNLNKNTYYRKVGAFALLR